MEVCLPNKEAGLELELVRPLSTCELISLAISTPKIDQTGPSTGSRNDHGRPVDARKRSGAPIDDLGRHLRGVSTEVEHNRQRRALRFLGFVATTSCLLGSVSSSVAGTPSFGSFDAGGCDPFCRRVTRVCLDFFPRGRTQAFCHSTPQKAGHGPSPIASGDASPSNRAIRRRPQAAAVLLARSLRMRYGRRGWTRIYWE